MVRAIRGLPAVVGVRDFARRLWLVPIQLVGNFWTNTLNGRSKNEDDGGKGREGNKAGWD